MVFEHLEWDDVLELFVTGLSALIFVVAAKAYVRTRTPRMMLFATAFGAYLLKGLFRGAEVLWFQENAALNALELVAETAALVLLLMAIVKG